MIQTTNIRRVLDDLARHPMMRDITLESVIEYTVDFISLMGTPGLYLEKTAYVDVNDWRGELPCDFEHMIQVRAKSKSGSTVTFRVSEDSFHLSENKHPDCIGNYTYKIQGMVIITSVRNVQLEIAYRAFAVDDDGFPLIPDNTSFMRGLKAYIKMNWFEMKYDQGKISQAVMDRADREYCWAAGDAYSEFSRLTLDEAESLFNSFKTLLPRNNEHWKGFFTNSSREIWKH